MSRRVHPARDEVQRGGLVHATLTSVAGAGHLIASVLVGVLILSGYRRVRRESRPVAALMALGIVARAVASVALFWISYLNLPVLLDLQSGGGFWDFAPDAQTYYGAARRAYFEGLSAIPPATRSPAYVTTLAGWMRLVGLSPASGSFLNISLFALLSVLVVRICRPGANRQAQAACAACIAPFSIAPALVVHSLQPLKDEAFVFLIAVACLSVLTLLRVPAADASAHRLGRSGSPCWALPPLRMRWRACGSTSSRSCGPHWRSASSCTSGAPEAPALLEPRPSAS